MENMVSDNTLRFMTCGSVDDGKSTLIGHLLYLTGNLYDDQFKTLTEESKRIGNAGDRIDFSLLLDGLIAEREQGITIDVAFRYFSSRKRKYIVADTPGHEEYTRNMATAASNCSAALILIDARLGVLDQTRRHSLICALSGIKHICFIVNKMDAVEWSCSRFEEILGKCKAIVKDLAPFGPLPEYSGIPVSALLGDNISAISKSMPWYGGPSVLEWLDTVPAAQNKSDGPFRFAVQYVIKPGSVRDRWQKQALDKYSPESSENYRGYAGMILSGMIRKGDEIVVLPSGRTSKVTGIAGPHGEIEAASDGMSVSLTIADRIDVSRGDSFIKPEYRQECADQFKAKIVWMQTDPLIAGRSYTFKSVYGSALANVTHFVSRIDPATYLPLAAEFLEMNVIGEAEIALNRNIPFDTYIDNKWSGSFLLIDRKTNATAGCGIIDHDLRRSENVHWQAFSVNGESRARLKHQRPALLWFTGLSGSGKSTIADLVEKKLYYLGKHTMVLDGDNIRHGLCKDLGFTEQDRVENIRRVGEVAKLMTDAGLIVLACFISPYRADREAVRGLCEKDVFHEIFVDAPLSVCESRDPKGLYRKARDGKIPNFTGVNAPYEEPISPELRVHSGEFSIEECVESILTYLNQKVLS
jgi:bifunctional enzyme CysN/CysC